MSCPLIECKFKELAHCINRTKDLKCRALISCNFENKPCPFYKKKNYIKELITK